VSAVPDRDKHRPEDRDAIAREAQRLWAAGLTSRDIADALRINVAAVRDLLRPIFFSRNTGHRPER